MRTISDKILKDRAYGIARNCGCDGYRRALASMAYKFVDKKIGLGAIATTKAGVNVNEQLAAELLKPGTKKLKRRTRSMRDNIWAADLAQMQSLFLKNKNVKYLLCVIDVFSKIMG